MMTKISFILGYEEIRIRDRFRKTSLKVTSVLRETKCKQQQNQVNNLKKQAKKK
jgi:hypothetical protein